MEFGFKRIDFLAFALFPRVWREIDRLRAEQNKLRRTIIEIKGTNE